MLRCCWIALALTLLGAGSTLAAQQSTVPGQPEAAAATATSGDDRSQDLSDLDKLTEKLQRDKKQRPPFEFFRSQVAPHDVLPYVKPHHWSTLTIELRANQDQYQGLLQTTSEVGGRPQIPLYQMPRAMVFGRDALLPRDQTLTRSFQFLMPRPTRQLFVELTRPGAIRPDFGWEASLQRLEPHQMNVVVLSPDPSVYNAWSPMRATIPGSGDVDRTVVDRQRYYRMVLPQVPDRPNLSAHPLTWTTISHVVWDGFEPENLSVGPLSQQQAMIDWLHFGGQLIVVASGPKLLALQESFLGPYLPATSSGAVASLTPANLTSLAAAYLPPNKVSSELRGLGNIPLVEPPRYLPVQAIAPTADRPLLLTGLEPRPEPGIIVHAVSPDDARPLAVEWRVGRGRVLMLAVNPNDPALAAWAGLDSLVRRLLLRRPEETWGPVRDWRAYQPLAGPDLSWVRYLARDLGAPATVTTPEEDQQPSIPGDLVFSSAPTAAWLDVGPELPGLTRETLEKASGITIPGAPFVLRVILAYLVALVPLNWLLCRYVLQRRELAWVLVPFLAFGFAYAVERAAAYDLGFDSACDEIDLLELQGKSGRAHLSRFASLYSTGRVDYQIAYPQDPTALALPMRSAQGLRGEELQISRFQSSPVPALTDFRVQPRSIAMFRAEAMVDLGGGIELVGDLESGKLVNGTDLDLLDATLIDTRTERVWELGRIGPWPRTPEAQAAAAHSLSLETASASPPQDRPDWAELENYLAKLRDYRWLGPEDQGELRLVAWVKDPHPGQSIEPAVDRHRGFRLVVAHLRYDLPDPASSRYYIQPAAAATVEPDDSTP